VPEADILGPLKTIALISALIMLAVLLLGIGIANYISKKIAAPIQELVKETEAIKNFELDKPTIIHSKIAELQTVSAAIDAMKKSLQSFKRYVPTLLVKKLFTSGHVAEVGGALTHITLLFADIKDFTHITEENPPARVTYYLSEYFETMSRIIHDRHGTLDKYVGDLIMAFWGAPSSDKFQAQHACKTAIDMLKQLKVLNLKWQQEDFASITIRIGINTGNAIVGNVGSTERLNYTALGDSVNLASRLQEVNKIYHTNVIVSEHTHQAVKSLFRFKLLDRIAVRGKQQAVCIYELEPEMSDEDLKNYNAKFEKAFDVYQKAHWDEAIYLFQQLMLHYPDDKVAPLFVARCQDLKEKNPTTWDGVWRLYE
jgi:adenylate cyclase